MKRWPRRLRRKLETNRSGQRRRRPAWGKIAFLLLGAALLAAAWRYTPLAELISRERVAAAARVARHTSWAPLAIVLAYTPAAVFMFPRPVITLLAVVAFGPWVGIAYGAAGIMLAALATYCAGLLMRYETVRRIAGDKLDAVTEVLRRHGVIGIFALNMVPTPPFAVQGVIAGAARMKLWHYALGTALGMAPALLAWTVFGEQIARVLEEPSRMSVWLMAAALLALAALTYGVRRWFARHAA
ncbi:MAG: DedA family protein [Betaproteobacteria bacterium]|nr:MAG: DedA family protein [Betaproteobacteria bacterium]